ncbi:MAG: hypothetical protein IKE94_08835 [Aeriscardovia sp.]|nr:hypothetical protein [Aeriscardovia sp.]
MDLYNQLSALLEQLNISIRSLRKTGQEYAEAERDYRMALSAEILRMEGDGRPVTNIYNIARGTKKVAEAKYKQIATEAVYKANMEAIQGIKLQIRVIQAQIDKEYGANLSD